MRFLAPALAVILAAASPAVAGGLRDRLYDPTQGVLVVAHRGCHAPAPSHGLMTTVPENSLAALERCIALGVDLVEIDVRRSQDGVLVVMHDARVDRTTDSKGRVTDLTFAKLQAMRLEASDEAPPTLEAVLRAARGRILVNIDLKGPYADQAVDMVRQTQAEDWVLFKAKAGQGMGPIADQPLYRHLAFMPMVAAKAARQPRALGQITATQASGAQAIPAIEMVALSPQGFAAVRDVARAARIRLWTNTLAGQGWKSILTQASDRSALRNPDKVWGRLIDQGVSIVQTDHPAALLDYLERRNLRGGTALALANGGSPPRIAQGGAATTH